MFILFSFRSFAQKKCALIQKKPELIGICRDQRYFVRYL